MANNDTKKFGKKELLLEAALAEFSRHNYEQASLNTILETSGVGKGNFYYHFKNKETLFLAVLERLLQAKLDFLSTRSGYIEAGSGIFSLLRAHGRLSEEFALTDPRIEGFLYRLSNELPACMQDKVNALMGKSSASYFRDMVSAAREGGEIRDDLPVDFISRLLTFLFTNFARAFVDSDRNRNLDSTRILADFERYMDFIEAGLEKK